MGDAPSNVEVGDGVESIRLLEEAFKRVIQEGKGHLCSLLIRKTSGVVWHGTLLHGDILERINRKLALELSLRQPIVFETRRIQDLVISNTGDISTQAHGLYVTVQHNLTKLYKEIHNNNEPNFSNHDERPVWWPECMWNVVAPVTSSPSEAKEVMVNVIQAIDGARTLLDQQNSDTIESNSELDCKWERELRSAIQLSGNCLVEVAPEPPSRIISLLQKFGVKHSTISLTRTPSEIKSAIEQLVTDKEVMICIVQDANQVYGSMLEVVLLKLIDVAPEMKFFVTFADQMPESFDEEVIQEWQSNFSVTMQSTQPLEGCSFLSSQNCTSILRSGGLWNNYQVKQRMESVLSSIKARHENGENDAAISESVSTELVQAELLSEQSMLGLLKSLHNWIALFSQQFSGRKLHELLRSSCPLFSFEFRVSELSRMSANKSPMAVLELVGLITEFVTKVLNTPDIDFPEGLVLQLVLTLTLAVSTRKIATYLVERLNAQAHNHNGA